MSKISMVKTMGADMYQFKKIEEKWKDRWYEDNVCAAEDFSDKPKKYILAELPYPSGYALHAGHMMRYTVPEVYSRFLRMRGYNVMYPMGWDSFGLPAENFAIKTGAHPAETTQKAIKNFKESLIRMGYGIDWAREIDTSSPEYYKWTQWIFLKLWKAGLAEHRKMPVWWCEGLKTVLADEEVLTDKDGNKISEREGLPVERKMVKQWVLRITDYAEKLVEGLEQVDYQESVKTAQLNWIGRSEGALIKFETNTDKVLETFTTRPDTIFGVSFITISPEHPVLETLLEKAANKAEVTDYIKKAKNLPDLERQVAKEKTGVLIESVRAGHPFDETRKDIPIFVADYVLMNYGTGIVMGVPAHDERDLEFADTYGLPIIKVIDSENPTGDGTVVNSGEYNGMYSKDFAQKIIERLEKENKGSKKVTYRVRDQIFSRQRYWGEPIPLVHTYDGNVESICDPDNMEEVHKNLPLLLPEVPDYRPTTDGLSPLSRNEKWVNVTDFQGKTARRETDTMPTWAGSNWYYLRYIDPKNKEAFVDYEKMKYWLPVDKYFGDSGHTTMHLLYSRFWHRFLHDQGLVPTPEPYQWRLSGGLLLGPDGRKMSKSLGNIVDPVTVIDNYGADATRLYLCFIGPYEDTYPWNENGIKACWRLVKNIYEMKAKVTGSVRDESLEKAYHRMIKNITSMAENLKMNTAVSELMIFVNEAKKAKTIDRDLWKGFLRVVAPFAPFVAEELWQELNGFTKWERENSIHLQEWPGFDEVLATVEVEKIPVQVNGKIRGEVDVQGDDTEETLKQKLLNDPKISLYINEKKIARFLYIPEKIISLVTE
jgi:leucyl-tRNA synthetase